VLRIRHFLFVYGFLAAVVATTDASGKDKPDTSYHEGSLLVAAPKMPDVRFAETVIFLCRHNMDGAFGLILNRPAGKLPLSKLMKSLGMENSLAGEDIQIRLGGPVQIEAGFLMYDASRIDQVTADPQRICLHQGVAVSSNEEVIKSLGTPKAPTSPVLFFGYAGWGPGQLEGELQQGGWITIPADRGLLFDPDLKNLWRKATAKRGIDL